MTRRVFRFCLKFLLDHWYLPLLLFVVGILLGVQTAQSCAELEADVRWIAALEGRGLFGVIGALWACGFYGLALEDRGLNNAVARGVSRRALFLALLVLYLLGCLLCSLTAVLLSAGGAPLRCVLLRLALDLGVMLVPLLPVFAFRQAVPALCVGGVYGFAWLVSFRPNYLLWSPQAGYTAALSDLWPLGTLFLAPVIACLLWVHADLP